MNIEKLKVPDFKFDVVLDTDTYNEVDDTFALAYLLSYEERANIKGICAAPFHNSRSSGAKDGMEKSYDEILRILSLCKKEEYKDKVYKGSAKFMESDQEIIKSDAACFLAEEAATHTKENPLYIVAIGAITNVAQAFLMNPEIKDKVVVVWLGGHAHHMPDTNEFNMMQDFYAARTVMGSGAPFVQLPCAGVVNAFATTEPELKYWIGGKNALCDYLIDITKKYSEGYRKERLWSRVIWDVTAVAWLFNDGDKFMKSDIRHTPLPQNNGKYVFSESNPLMCYVYHIERDDLFEDLFNRLATF